MQQERTEKRKSKIQSVLSNRQPTLSVVMENVHDPHNVSAVLRSCDAVGVLHVHLLYHGGQEFPKLGAKSSASARKWVDTTKHTTVSECFSQLRSEGKKIYTTHLDSDAESLYDVDLAEPVAIVFGNEHAGVSEEARAEADGNIIIPQVGMIQSLNISVACAVTLFECFRQRRERNMYDTPQIPQNTLNTLFEDWCQR